MYLYLSYLAIKQAIYKHTTRGPTAFTPFGGTSNEDRGPYPRTLVHPKLQNPKKVPTVGGDPPPPSCATKMHCPSNAVGAVGLNWGPHG